MLEVCSAPDLYEPAAAPVAPARMHLGEHTLYLGTLGQVARHTHATAVLVVGLYEDVGFRQASGAGHTPWRRGQAVVVPGGVAHELQTGDAPVAVFYPSRARADEQTLGALLRQRRASDGASRVGNCVERPRFRALYESRVWTPAEAGGQLDDLLSSKRLIRHTRAIDPRVLETIDQLHRAPQHTHALGGVAATHGLSPSRLMHLFAEHLNTPFRRYRTWCRLQAAMREAGTGVSLTQAALAAGFSDSQHFSREFKRAFGVTASDVMRRLRSP